MPCRQFFGYMHQVVTKAWYKNGVTPKRINVRGRSRIRDRPTDLPGSLRWRSARGREIGAAVNRVADYVFILWRSRPGVDAGEWGSTPSTIRSCAQLPGASERSTVLDVISRPLTKPQSLTSVSISTVGGCLFGGRHLLIFRRHLPACLPLRETVSCSPVRTSFRE
jgi:hypothetical protein